MVLTKCAYMDANMRHATSTHHRVDLGCHRLWKGICWKSWKVLAVPTYKPTVTVVPALVLHHLV